MAFRIRAEQMAEFERSGMDAFEDEMMAHSKEFSPRLCKVLGDDQLRVAVRQAITRAGDCGFTYRGPIRLYIELMFLFGSDFATDPQYPEIAKVLNNGSDQMLRAQRICDVVGYFVDVVAGKDNLHVKKAERFLADFARSGIEFQEDGFEETLLGEFEKAYPQKYAYVGPDAMNRLIAQGRKESLKYGMDSLRAQAMLAILMFSFGHGCTNDPLYPWISHTLSDDQIVDGKSRARRLEKKARTWLEHVLARTDSGESA